MRVQLFTLIFFNAIILLNAQVSDKDWVKNPIFNEIENEDLQKDAIALFENSSIEMKYSYGSYNNYIHKHSLISVHSDKGVQQHNKLYIPIRDTTSLINFKARVIQPDGSVQNFNRKNIKLLSNLKEKGNYSIFALEGVQVNSQIEYLYTIRESARSNGYLVFQKDYLIKESKISISLPTHIHLKYKFYNSSNEFKENIESKVNKYQTLIKDIPAMIDEKVSASRANRQKIAYTFYQNSISESQLWENLSKGLQTRFLQFDVKLYSKYIKKFASNYPNFENLSKPDQINTICKYIYSNFQINNNPNTSEKLKQILKFQQANDMGIVKVYSLLFQYYNINFNLNLTSDRFRHRFDKDFYSNYNLEQILFYFPSEGKYVNPNFKNSYLGFPPFEYIGNQTLIVNSYGYRFKEIQSPLSIETMTIRKFDINVNDEENALVVLCEQQLTGYKGHVYRSAFNNHSKMNKLDEYKNNMCLSGIEDAVIDDFTVGNTDLESKTENKPFLTNWSYSSPELINSVNGDLYLSIGKVIGTQMEFYQEEERVNDIEIRYPNKYDYDFKVNIPDGYYVANIDDFNFNKSLNVEDHIICQFVSKGIINAEGDLLIKVNEDYNSIRINVDNYPLYKDVINSAYDFFEKILVLKKN